MSDHSKQTSERQATRQSTELHARRNHFQETGRTSDPLVQPPPFAGPNVDGTSLLQRLAPPQQRQALLALQRTHGNAAVQRDLAKEIPFLGKSDSIWGNSVSQITYKPRGTFMPSAMGTISQSDFPDGDGTVGTVHIPAGSDGTLQISMDVVVKERGPQPGSPATFRQSTLVRWRVNSAANGDLTIDPGAEHRQPPNGDRVTRSRLSEVKQTVVSDNAAHRHYLVINPVVSGTVYKDYSDSTSGPSQTYEFDQPFTLHIKVAKEKPRLGPPYAIHSEPVFFRVKDHRLEDGQFEALKRFYDGLDQSAKDGIANGTATVQIDANASTPGSHEDNQDLSRRRGQRVRQLLIDWAGLNEARANHLRVYANGETSHGKRGEARSERRVEVWVWPFGTP